MISGHGFKNQDIFDVIALIVTVFFILVGIYAIYRSLKKEYKSSKNANSNERKSIDDDY